MPSGKPSKNSAPTSFESTRSVLERLYAGPAPVASASGWHGIPAAIIFAAVIQTRATDRLTKAVEAQTAALVAKVQNGGK